MTQMTKQDTSRRHKSRNSIFLRAALHRMLDILLAFDRSVVELSMGLYNLPRRDRVIMREQNRRLHHALREGLPRILEQPRSSF